MYDGGMKLTIDFPLVVVAPAVCRAGAVQPAGMNVACDDRPKRIRAGNRRGGISARRRAISELSAAIVSPAVGGAARDDSTCVSASSGDRLKNECGAYSNRRTHSSAGGSVAKFAGLVIAPAVGSTGGRNATSVIIAGGNILKAQAARDSHRGRKVGSYAAIP